MKRLIPRTEYTVRLLVPERQHGLGTTCQVYNSIATGRPYEEASVGISIASMLACRLRCIETRSHVRIWLQEHGRNLGGIRGSVRS